MGFKIYRNKTKVVNFPLIFTGIIFLLVLFLTYFTISNVMNKNGCIILIEDDIDDEIFFTEALSELGYPNEIICFCDGTKALEYLNTDDIYPFLILSDINLPRLNGLELKKMIHTNSKISQKCIPYLFFTTSANEKSVYEAYTMSAQGFFVKPTDFGQLKNMISLIMEYWSSCYAPNNFKTSI